MLLTGKKIRSFINDKRTKELDCWENLERIKLNMKSSRCGCISNELKKFFYEIIRSDVSAKDLLKVVLGVNRFEIIFNTGRTKEVFIINV